MKQYIRNKEPQVKTISIHGLDPEAERLLQQRARKQNLSLNRVLKSILNETLGLGPKKRDHRSEFVDLSGIWTQDEDREFAVAVGDFEKTDPDDWP